MPFSLKLPQISRTKRLLFVIISCTIYFFVEITIGLKTGSLALVVDAFHQLNDLISYVVALVATRLTISSKERPGFTFALKRCEIVGAFFNASILLALALSIFLQAIERFIDVPEVEEPFLVLIVGLVGVVLNSLCIMLCHDTHGHSHGHSHGSHNHTHPTPVAHAHHHENDHQHQHHHYSKEEPSNEISDGAFHQTLQEEIRAVRIPSIVTQIARPISHMIQDHGYHHGTGHSHAQSHTHPHSHNPLHPHTHATADSATRDPIRADRTSRFSRWRNTLFFQDEETWLGMKITQPNLTVAIPGAGGDGPKHRSLDPGSPRYVMPDSQRWYDGDEDRLEPRAVVGGVGITAGDQGAENDAGQSRGHDHQAHSDHDHPTHPDNHHHTHGGSGGHGGHSHNLGFAGVLVHLLGDALNNIGVVIAAVVMWKSTSTSRFYADPAVSVAIGLIIFAGSLPLTISSARVLLEAAPKGLDLKQLQEDLVQIPGVASVHCLHVWQLTETDLICSLDVRSEARDLVVWSLVEKHIRRHLAVHGINHVTISPEFVPSSFRSTSAAVDGDIGKEADAGEPRCAALNTPKA